jgi:pimeloyl-ACP methyl ester carboxylesterase
MECSSYGLECRKSGPGSCAVIFIHGFYSDSKNCWRHVNGTYWPELVSNSDVTNQLSVYTYTYQSDVFSAGYDLDDVVDDLRQRMRAAALDRSSRIVFVCHSMGGIVARRLLVRSRLDSNVGRPVQSFGLLLVASPSLGSDWTRWLTPIARFFKHSQADALRFSSTNRWLDSLDRDFRDLKESGGIEIRGRELIEDKFIILRRFFFLRQIVERVSGARYFGESLKVAGSDPHGCQLGPIDRSHRD